MVRGNVGCPRGIAERPPPPAPALPRGSPTILNSECSPSPHGVGSGRWKGGSKASAGKAALPSSHPALAASGLNFRIFRMGIRSAHVRAGENGIAYSAGGIQRCFLVQRECSANTESRYFYLRKLGPQDDCGGRDLTSRHWGATDTVASLYWCGCVSPFLGAPVLCGLQRLGGGSPTPAGACRLSTRPCSVPPGPCGPGSPPCAGGAWSLSGLGLGQAQGSRTRRDLPPQPGAPPSFISVSALRRFWGKSLTQGTVPQRAGSFH